MQIETSRWDAAILRMRGWVSGVVNNGRLSPAVPTARTSAKPGPDWGGGGSGQGVAWQGCHGDRAEPRQSRDAK